MFSLARTLPPSVRRPLELLDDHRVIARLGRGGMAEIFLATRPGAHARELVVLKQLHPEDDEDPVILQMFLDEARLALRLTHQNIVRAHAIGVLSGRHALVLEFLEGQPLQALLKRAATAGRRLPLNVVASAFADVLEGLHYAHELSDEHWRPLNVVHRDVSPHNLFVTTAGELKLLDFGIAKTEIQENHTRTGLLKGKVAYMAPEQAHGSPVERRADIWSAGVALWESIAGVRLFKADNEAASLRLTLTGPVAPLSSVRDDVPRALEAIVSRALRRNPQDRYPTAKTMADELRVFAEEHDAPIAAPFQPLMDELFGRDTAEQRARIAGLLAGQDDAPSSSSVPVLVKQVLSQEPAGATLVSSVSTFLDELHERQRRGFRRVFLLLGLLFSAVLVLGHALITRQGGFLAALTPLPLTPAAPSAPVASPQLAAAVPAASVAVTAAQPPPFAATEPSSTLVEPATANATKSRGKRSGHPKKSAEPEPLSAPPVPHSPEGPSRPTLAETAPAVPTAEYGYLTLDTSPWSQVTAGGVALGSTPLVRVKLSAGPHTLVLTNSERGLSTTYPVTIEGGKTTVRRVGLE